MLRRSVAVAVGSCLLLLAIPEAFPQHGGRDVPRRPPRVPKEGDVDVPYWGPVTELTKNSITIQWTATPGVKPRTFQVSETLAAGKVPKEPRRVPDRPGGYNLMPSHMYRLTDVKVGDWVSINYAHLGGVDICDHICIQKRPGGLIPPLPDEAEALLKPAPPPPGRPPKLYIPYHEYMNAYWDLEEKGIPYPEKFGHRRRFPVAPLPREVKVGPPVAP